MSVFQWVDHDLLRNTFRQYIAVIFWGLVSFLSTRGLLASMGWTAYTLQFNVWNALLFSFGTTVVVAICMGLVVEKVCTYYRWPIWQSDAAFEICVLGVFVACLTIY